MDSDTLYTASTYLNNLLLARGLLRNGKPLDFAKPTRDTRAQIINLVHDLLLRRDRDQENREQISITLRASRTDQTRKDAELERQKIRLDEKGRGLLQAQTETRNVKAEMKRLEANSKALHEQLARLKASVAQIKTQCANDVRKRDVHIERLKSHLQGQQRGNRGGVVAPTMNLVNGTGGGASFAKTGSVYNSTTRELEDPEYSLKQESNDFLTQLGQSLSDENDGLINMLRNTLQTMKDLLGLDKEAQDVDTTSFAENQEDHQDGIVFETDALPISYDALAAEMDSTLEVLSTVLTSPNFVSMDEVESRDDEIVRLREGWEMMEARWKEVLLMMNMWRNRMEKTGDTINLEDLKKGLGLGQGLGEGLTSSQTERSSSVTGEEEQDSSRDQDEMNSNQSTKESEGGDSGIGEEGSPSPTRRNERCNNRVQSSRHKALDPPEIFTHKAPKDRHLQTMSPNAQSPRRVAFVEATAKSSPSSSFTQHLDRQSGKDNTRIGSSPTRLSAEQPSSLPAARLAQSVSLCPIGTDRFNKVQTTDDF